MLGLHMLVSKIVMIYVLILISKLPTFSQGGRPTPLGRLTSKVRATTSSSDTCKKAHFQSSPMA
jgi:hypothetical protein